MIDAQERVVYAIVKYALDIFYSFDEKEYDKSTIFNINSIKFTLNELLPLKDDIEKYILYTCYFSQKNISFTHILRSMVFFNISTYNKNNLDHTLTEKIDLKVMREFCLTNMIQTQIIDKPIIYNESKDSLYAFPLVVYDQYNEDNRNLLFQEEDIECTKTIVEPKRRRQRNRNI